MHRRPRDVPLQLGTRLAIGLSAPELHNQEDNLHSNSKENGNNDLGVLLNFKKSSEESKTKQEDDEDENDDEEDDDYEEELYTGCLF